MSDLPPFYYLLAGAIVGWLLCYLVLRLTGALVAKYEDDDR